MDYKTLSFVIEQINLIDKSSISGDDLKRYVSNLKNNLQNEIDRVEAQMYEEMFLRDSDGYACLGGQI